MPRQPDDNVSRCGKCGNWTWRGACAVCAPTKGLITATAVRPWTHYCHECGKVWEPPNTRGLDYPSDTTLNLSIANHRKECRGPK